MSTIEGFDDDYCYLVTRGRITGRPHEVEIWFAVAGTTLYLLSGGRDRADWVRNVLAEPSASVRLRDTTYRAHGRVLTPATNEDTRARSLVYDKYTARGHGGLDRWREHALPVALDVEVDATA